MDKRWPSYTCTYQFDGCEYGLTVPARSPDEARRRLRAIGMTARVDGELFIRLPVNSVTRIGVRIFVFLANLFRRRS
jgi:hypothetical protein